MLFRVSMTPHNVGDLIAPGHFGAQYRQFRPGGPLPKEPDFTNLLIELALEAARKAAQPNAPSRFDSIFACEKIEDARHFQATYRGGGGFIYGVEPAEMGTPTFRGDFSAISTPAGPVPYVDYLSDWGRGYWTNDPRGIVEMLVGGAVRVVSGPL